MGDSKVRNVKLQSLRKEFENMKMKENESIKNETVQDSRSLLNQMKVYGEEISDKNIFEKVFISLLENFDPI